MGRPRVYDESLRERLIEEARKLLTEDGYHGVSLRVLTKNVGTSTNAVYTLFGSKESLMAEVVVRELDDMAEQRQQIDRTGDPQEDLVNLARFYRSRAAMDPKAFMGIFEALEEAGQPGSLTERMNPETKNIANRLRGPLEEYCQSVLEQFPGLDLDPDSMALSLWSVIHGFVILEIAGALGAEAEATDDLFERSVLASYAGWIPDGSVA